MTAEIDKILRGEPYDPVKVMAEKFTPDNPWRAKDGSELYCHGGEWYLKPTQRMVFFYCDQLTWEDVSKITFRFKEHRNFPAGVATRIGFDPEVELRLS